MNLKKYDKSTPVIFKATVTELSLTCVYIQSSSDLERNGTTIMPSFLQEHWQQRLAMGI